MRLTKYKQLEKSKQLEYICDIMPEDTSYVVLGGDERILDAWECIQYIHKQILTSCVTNPKDYINMLFCNHVIYTIKEFEKGE